MVVKMYVNRLLTFKKCIMKARKYVLVILGVIILFFILSKFSVTKDADLLVFEEIENELGIEIEDWMSNDLFWDLNIEKNQIFTMINVDAAFEIESWMTNDKIWRF